jgi:hypothetical protein
VSGQRLHQARSTRTRLLFWVSTLVRNALELASSVLQSLASQLDAPLYSGSAGQRRSTCCQRTASPVVNVGCRVATDLDQSIPDTCEQLVALVLQFRKAIA